MKTKTKHTNTDSSPESAGVAGSVIPWLCCKCGSGGTGYPKDAAMPEWVASIEFDGCEACDPYGEDSFRYLNSAGEHGMLNPDGTRHFISPNN